MTERENFEEAFWANLGEQADANGPSVDFGWLCDAMADTVAEMLAAARREALLEAADAYSDFEVFVAADGINSLRTHGLEPDAWIRRYSERYTAEPERDEEGGR